LYLFCEKSERMRKLIPGNRLKLFFFGNCTVTFVFFFVFAVSNTVSGQKILPSPDDLYYEALENMFADEYKEALPILLDLYQKGFQTPNICYKIGECYLNIQGQKTRAIPFLKEAVQKASKSYTGFSLQEEVAPFKSFLYLGIAYRINNDLDHALNSFDAYLHSLDREDTEGREMVKYHIDRCFNARELIASPAKFNSDTLPENINSEFSNSNPLVTPDEKLLYYMDQHKFYDAVMRAEKIDTIWQNPENLTPEIRSDGDYYLTGMSINGAQLFLTFYDPYKSGEICFTEIQNPKWNKMHRLNGNINTLFNETHASLAPNGKTLYFTSDRKGGYGGLDIYSSELTESGEWGPAVNLGPLINSPYNEETPFVSTDSKKLFFSSQGHYNMGGYDIFYSSLSENGQWLPPVNIGFPINTTDDDLFFFPLGSGNTAYLSRFSQGSVQQNIVRYHIISFGNPARYSLNGYINLESQQDYYADNITVSFFNKDNNIKIAETHLNSDGTFIQKLSSGSFKIDFTDNNSLLLTKNLEIPEYLPQYDLVLNETITIKKKNVTDTLFIKNIRFDFDRSNLKEDFISYLNKLAEYMYKYHNLKLQVNGYADSRGNEIYNLALSMKRAISVRDYLLAKNITSDRIQVNAFGEQNPIAKNKNSDGTDNPKGRKFNRRVESVLSNIPQELIIIEQTDIPVELRCR
jgi:outer membrane protein OmpA-like peptidoglycan-associated protein